MLCIKNNFIQIKNKEDRIMSTKKVSYMNLLKEAIQGVDPGVVNTVDVKGPMLDPILKYSGEGELQTHKDASSILERYYFGEDEDKGISVVEGDDPIDNTINEVPDKNLAKTKKDIEKEITEQDEKKEEDEKDKDEKEVNESEELENTIIEKLIEEMEEKDEDEDEKTIEENRVNGDRGAGTKAAGTEDGEPEKIIKGRKDKTNEGKKIAAEQEEEEPDLDVDKELGDDEIEEAMTPLKIGADVEDQGDEIEEAFKIFKEAIEDDEEEKEDKDKKKGIEDIKSDEVRV